MAEETQPKPAESTPTTEVAVEETKPKAEEQAPAEKAEPTAAPAAEEENPAEDAGEAAAEEAGVTQSVSFKEESNVVADLEDPEKKALDELKQLIQAALANKEFTPPPPPPPPPAPAPAAVEKAPAKEEEKKTEEPKTEEPKTEEPKTEEPKSQEPKTEEPKSEPKTEEPKTEEPKTEEPKSEEPISGAEVAASAPETVEATATVEVAATEKPEVAAPSSEEAAAPASASATTEVTEEKTEEADEGSKTATEPEPAAPEAQTPAPEEPPEEIFIWGVPLIEDEMSDTVLLKFLRARDFKVKEAMTMIKNAVIWRKQFDIDSLIEEDLQIPELQKVVFNHGFDKEGHPVCYNVYGELQDKELYAKAFGDEEKRERFLRWRIQFLEKGIRELLDFSPGAVCSMVQVTDLKNTPGPGKKELRIATKKALTLLQDNYPEFVAKQIFINVPWWYVAYNKVIGSIFTPRSKSKFVFAASSKSADTLFKYIAPEQVPVQYGGLSKENDTDFTTADAVTEFIIKPASKHTIEIPATEGSTVIWEFRVLGWEVTYGAEFAPTAESGYTVIIQKARKFVPTDEPYVKNSFKIGEPGKVVLTIDNATSKKKKLLYRYKEKTYTEST